MRKLFVAALAACALSACERVEIAENGDMGGVISDSYSKKFTFTVKGDFINPEFTRANAYMTADGSEMTDLWVVDYKDGEIKQQLHQTSADQDWGAPVMNLTLGTHHVLFLASRGTEPTYANGVVTWTKAMDAFYTDYEVTVSKTSNGNRAVTLDRVATKLTIAVTDAVPSGTTTISLTPTKWYTGWNMLTGEPVASAFSRDFVLSSSQWGATDLELNIWSMSGADEWLTDVAIVAKAGETITSEALIQDAPMKRNRVTRFSGALWSQGGSSSVSLSSDWLTQYEGVY